MIRVFVMLWLAGLLAGCSTMSSWYEGVLGGEDNSAPLAPLTKIEKPVSLARVWSDSIGVGHDEQFVNLAPAVDDGRLYIADRKGRVVALDAATGKEFWSVQTGAVLSAGPAVGSGQVLLGSSDAEVIALDSGDGSLRWKVEVSSEVLSQPRLDLDRVIVQTADGSIAGLDAENGEQVWVIDRTVPVLTLRGTSSPAVKHGLVIAGFSNGKLAAFSAEKGFIAWEKSIAIPQGRSELERIVDIDGSPVIAGDAAYVATYQGRIARIDIQDGNTSWERDMSSSAGLGVDYSQVYVTDDNSHVWALSRSNGASAWKLEALENRGLTAPAPFDDYVVVADTEGYVHLLSRYDGHIAGRIELDSKGINTPPLVVGDMLYVYGNSGKLAAFSIQESR
ncbi:MAG: outer membrane protein assembly factor BamB [Gammaproteobacteria bacterium]|nr:outer membrane protein assembly factor BamB [Gammaproteobacteria bacterium]